MAVCELVFDIGGATQKLGLLWPFSLQPAPGSTWFKEQEAGAEATIGPACAPPLRAAQKRSPGLPQPSEAPVCLGEKKMAEYLRLPNSLALIRLCNPPVNALRYHRRDRGVWRVWVGTCVLEGLANEQLAPAFLLPTVDPSGSGWSGTYRGEVGAVSSCTNLPSATLLLACNPSFSVKPRAQSMIPMRVNSPCQRRPTE